MRFLLASISAVAAFVLVAVLCVRAEEKSAAKGNNTRLLLAGVSSIDITPEKPIRLSGYGNRATPSEGVDQKLHAKAIAIGEGTKEAPLSVLITLDAIGIPAWLSKEVCDRLEKRQEIDRGQIAIAASHTHAAPSLKGCIPFMHVTGLTKEESETIDTYARSLADKLEQVALDAIGARSPSFVTWGKGELNFAGNRRVLEDGKWKGFGTQEDGPVDHSMPFLRVDDESGKAKAVFINYACHCTTLGSDYNRIHGDWAGEAQAEIEKRHPDITALIAIGCGADQNPNPRGAMDQVLRHGISVADEVDRMLKKNLENLNESPVGIYQEIDLPLEKPVKRSVWERQVEKGEKGSHFAKAILEKLDRGEKLDTHVTYPIQTWTFGEDLAMVFLGGEVVVDYAHRFYRQFDADRLWINAYSNDVPCYIPTRRLYEEGGYEVDYSMVYYGKPARLAPDTEDRISDEVTRQLPHSFYSKETLANIPSPVEKENALATIQVPDAYEVELVAAEPLVMDPVDIAWDTKGQLWVVEMADYPTGINGKTGGRVRILEDVDEDGIYDTSHLFLDGLKYPNSLFPWRDGVLIVTADSILFAKDTNGDFKSDFEEALFTGFESGNAQHQLGSLQWGLDNWIHVGNGDSEGAFTSIKTGESIDLGARDMRFRPDTGEVSALSGKAQFGLTRDDWGNWFACNNSRPWWHYALENNYLERNPHIPYPDPKVFLTDEPLAGPVYPTSRTVSRFNDYDKTGRFTSACGLTAFRDKLPDYPDKTSLFVAEPVHNLVSRILLEPNGSTFSGARSPSETESEFFTSTDNWCRPTSIRTGPDGALYIVDMYRLVIEHPEWIPEAWQRRLNLCDGHDRGRIYRIRQKGRSLRKAQDLTNLSISDLIKELETSNGTRRDLAHLEITWRNDGSTKNVLVELVKNSPYPETRVQCLAILDGMSELDESILSSSLTDPHPFVRKHAVRLSEASISKTDSSLHELIQSLTHDENPFVVQQLAYSLGCSADPRSGDALARILRKYGDDSHVRSAALSSVYFHLTSVIRNSTDELSSLNESVFTALLQTAIGKEEEPSLTAFFKAVENVPLKRLVLFVNTLESTGWTLQELKRGSGGKLANTIENLDERITREAVKAFDGSVSTGERILAVSLLGASTSGPEPDIEVLASLLTPRNPVEVQKAAIDRAAKLGSLEIAKRLLAKWDTYGSTVRKEALATFLSRRSWTGLFMGKLIEEPEWVRLLDVSQRSILLEHTDKLIREQASTLFVNGISSRSKALETFLPALTLKGDPTTGQQHFLMFCASCHKAGDTGFHVGPDLASLTNLSRESLLTAIIAPNKAVESKYAMYTARTKDNRTVTGILTSETGSGVTLLGPAGVTETILRSQLQSFESKGKSLMPEGLEAGLNVQEMADLLSFLESVGSSPVVEPIQGSIRLVPANGTGNGNSIKMNTGLGAFSWIDGGDRVEWLANVPAGRYSIFFDAGRTGSEDVPRETFELKIGDISVLGAVQYTGDLNRLRKRLFGEIYLTKPLQKVKIEFQHKMEDGQLTVREIALIPQ